MKFLDTYIDIVNKKTLINKEAFIDQLSLEFTRLNENLETISPDKNLITSIVAIIRNLLARELIAKKQQGINNESPKMCAHMNNLLTRLQDPRNISVLKEEHSLFWENDRTCRLLGQWAYEHIDELLSKDEGKIRRCFILSGHELEADDWKKKGPLIAEITALVIALKLEALERYTAGDRIEEPKKHKKGSTEKWKSSLLGSTLATPGNPAPLAAKNILTKS